ncbi:MAG: hypothetical protein E5Y58_32345 [Mesorhizobium sp.]|nr:MAG: hypothetical protein E5Y58_32345 [Mesorhizobium sp.]
MRGAPAWHRQHSVQHPSSVSALRADPPPGASHEPRPPFGPHRGRRKKGATSAPCYPPQTGTSLPDPASHKASLPARRCRRQKCAR